MPGTHSVAGPLGFGISAMDTAEMEIPFQEFLAGRLSGGHLHEVLQAGGTL
jgi:hypothetical protein